MEDDMGEKIRIFTCPYWDKCTDLSGYFIVEKCPHPFIKIKGGSILCALEMEPDGDYDKIMSQITLYRP